MTAGCPGNGGILQARRQRPSPDTTLLGLYFQQPARGTLVSRRPDTILRRGSRKRPDPPPSARPARTCHPSLQEAKPVKRRLLLFLRHGCSVARNSSACKGKSLRCLRKSRFPYIDTSPALSARRHLDGCFASFSPASGLSNSSDMFAPTDNLGAVA